METDTRTARELYLDLLRDTIINAIYKDPPLLATGRGPIRKLFGIRYRNRAFDAGKRSLEVGAVDCRACPIV